MSKFSLISIKISQFNKNIKNYLATFSFGTWPFGLQIEKQNTHGIVHEQIKPRLQHNCQQIQD